jgi:putative glutathione S-transferase
MEHIKNHYYASHETINPSRVIPNGPAIDFALPHDRGKFG